ncbi:ATP-binding cassette domain-containing protein [Pseudoalteromonas sp. OOF1S-7]|uniref:ATP-binding cassette domain-containing protein n=1 Tax=Pseudoalteromonas sp. OOF1S-7 TaxID=2917757 RepID=UPI001EF63231|nr:ATP-binding cassette domain-containing protein [Pseudoalteromonas sp. OOF1S-7]MCG7533466.1 ATP-binding cassette domain-containing protein [Pseudoalteromonas sp. OOF1S-7]
MLSAILNTFKYTESVSEHRRDCRSTGSATIDVQVSLPVSQRFSCTLLSGQVGVLLAPSGAGKTSLFNALAGLSPATGSIQVGSKGDEQIDLPAYQRRIAYVTQSPTLFGHLSIQALLNLVSAEQKNPFDVSWAVELLNLSGVLHLRAQQLSGGQQQRVALLLAMIKGAPLLLLDEVLSGQDHTMKHACIALIKEFLKQTNAAALMVCHQMEDALALADKALVLQDDGSCKHWQAMPVGAGLHLYQHQLLASAQGSSNGRENHASEFLSVVQATTLTHRASLGLTEYRLNGQACFSVHTPHTKPGQVVSLVLKANRVGLSRTIMPDSSFVNQWLATITSTREIVWQGEQGMLIDVKLVSRDDSDVAQCNDLSVWITRLSFNQLKPAVNEPWYLISKADALSFNSLH